MLFIYVLDDVLNGPKISMDDPNLVKKLRTSFLVKPIKESEGKRIRYNLSNMSIKDTSMGQAIEIAKILDYTVIISYKLINCFQHKSFILILERRFFY